MTKPASSPGGAASRGAPLSRNPLSIAGAIVTTVSAVAFIVYGVLDGLGLILGPYAGLLGYVALPAVVLLGLALVPMGMWREGRRRRHGHPEWRWPAIDLERARTREVATVVLALTIVNLGIVTVASVGVVHYTESDRFCGQVCHTPMTPEFTSHLVSPHARVECVSCHVGSGAKGFVSAKLNGTRQLYLVLVDRYSRPIPEPLDRLPHAVETCAGCHTPGRPDEDLTRAITTYADDEKSTESVTTLTLRMAANHWHARADTDVEFVATDPTRQTIPYIRVTDAQGGVTEYFSEGVKARPEGVLHRMDCLDCHNRPAHTFAPSADQAVDAALASGEASRALPFLHREMVVALQGSYATTAAAQAGIASHLRDAYRTASPGLAPDVDRAVAVTERLYHDNVFPDMKVTWGTYLSQLGHVDTPGCFRCHDGSHQTRDGKAVRQDCELCHHIQ